MTAGGQDKAGRAFWDSRWNGLAIPKRIDPANRRLSNHLYRRFHQFFSHTFDMKAAAHQTLLEVGCGRSRWLPYFAKEFGFQVTGIDYSPIGCDQAQAILQKADVDGRIVRSDFFAPPDDMLGAFDVVVSFGVVEHFADTAHCISMLSRFLRPDGTLLTLIPNFAGVLGKIQKMAARSVYDVHVILDDKALARAHQNAGLRVTLCRYFLSINWAVVSFKSRQSAGALRSLRPALLKGLSMPFWLLERYGVIIPENHVTSPYIICVARKDTAAAIKR